MSKFTLFDLASRDPCECWSYNPWKTRLLLNYKNLPYETKWVEYPEIKPTLKPHVEANKEGMEYTIPTVIFPDGTYMQDSRQIANRVERDHPDPALNLNSEMLKKLEVVLPKVIDSLRPDFVPKMPKRLLNSASVPYWCETREKRFGGRKLDLVEQEEGGDTAYMNAAPYIQEVSQMLKVNSNGPFFEGSRLSYADLVWVAFLKFMQRIGDDLFEKVLEVSGDREVHLSLFKSCGPWLERGTH